MTLAEAAAHADELAVAGDQKGLANLRREWDDELESSARYVGPGARPASSIS